MSRGTSLKAQMPRCQWCYSNLATKRGLEKHLENTQFCKTFRDSHRHICRSCGSISRSIADALEHSSLGCESQTTILPSIYHRRLVDALNKLGHEDVHQMAINILSGEFTVEDDEPVMVDPITSCLEDMVIQTLESGDPLPVYLEDDMKMTTVSMVSDRLMKAMERAHKTLIDINAEQSEILEIRRRKVLRDRFLNYIKNERVVGGRYDIDFIRLEVEAARAEKRTPNLPGGVKFAPITEAKFLRLPSHIQDKEPIQYIPKLSSMELRALERKSIEYEVRVMYNLIYAYMWLSINGSPKDKRRLHIETFNRYCSSVRSVVNGSMVCYKIGTQKQLDSNLNSWLAACMGLWSSNLTPFNVNDATSYLTYLDTEVESMEQLADSISPAHVLANPSCFRQMSKPLMISKHAPDIATAIQSRYIQWSVAVSEPIVAAFSKSTPVAWADLLAALKRDLALVESTTEMIRFLEAI